MLLHLEMKKKNEKWTIFGFQRSERLRAGIMPTIHQNHQNRAKFHFKFIKSINLIQYLICEAHIQFDCNDTSTTTNGKNVFSVCCVVLIAHIPYDESASEIFMKYVVDIRQSTAKT